MEILEHFKETYHKENERTKNINEGLSIPIGIITLLATAVAYYVSNFEFTENIILTIIFLCLMIAGSVFLCLAIYDLNSAYNITLINPALSYKLLPTADEQEDYYLKLKESYTASGHQEEEAERKANHDLCSYLQDRYIEYSSNNSLINDKAEELVTKGKKRILMALIGLMATFIPYSINHALKQDHASKIEILKSVPLSIDTSSLKLLNMADKIKDSIPGNSVKPSPPAGREIKGGKVISGNRLIREAKSGKFIISHSKGR